MVCDDESPGTVLKLFRSQHLEVDQAQESQHDDVEAKEEVDHELVAFAPPARRCRQVDDREYRQREKCPPSEEGCEGDASAGQAPEIVQAVKHGAKSRSYAHLPTPRIARPRAGSGESQWGLRSMA